MDNPNSPQTKPLPKTPTGVDPVVRQKMNATNSALKLGVNVSQAAAAQKKLEDLTAKNPTIPYGRLLSRLNTGQQNSLNKITSAVPSNQFNSSVPLSKFRNTLRVVKTAADAAKAAEKVANESVEFTDKEQISEIMTGGHEQNPPNIIVLRRRGIRIFPDGKRVALYDNKQLGLVITVPYKGKGFTVGDIPNVTSEGFDPEPKEIAAHLIKTHGKGKVTDKHISEYEKDRDSNNPLDHEEIMDHVKKMSEETDATEKEVKMARGIAFDKRYKSGNMTGATNAIEKIRKGLSSHPQVKAALQSANEEVELDEAKMSAAVKLQRAFEIEQMKSKASRERGQKLMSQIRADLAAKKEGEAAVHKAMEKELERNPHYKTEEVKEELVDEAKRVRSPEEIARIQKALERERKNDKPGMLKRSDDVARKRYSKPATLDYFSKRFGEEVEHIEENLDALKKIADSGKHGTLKFKDGSSTKVHPQVAGVVHQLHGALNDENKKKIEGMISHSADHFDKVANFAINKSQWTINK